MWSPCCWLPNDWTLNYLCLNVHQDRIQIIIRRKVRNCTPCPACRQRLSNHVDLYCILCYSRGLVLLSHSPMTGVSIVASSCASFLHNFDRNATALAGATVDFPCAWAECVQEYDELHTGLSISITQPWLSEHVIPVANTTPMMAMYKLIGTTYMTLMLLSPRSITSMTRLRIT
jgi:hypothetical protein